MIIGIDASSLTLTNPTGVQRYAEYIIRYLLQVGKQHTFRLYTPLPLPNQFKDHQKIIPASHLWTQARLPLELFFNRPDVFFQPAYMLPPFAPMPCVVTVHDLGWIKHPQAYSPKQLMLNKLSIKRIRNLGAKVIVPSKSTKADLVKLMHISSSTIEVIPEGLIQLPHATASDIALVEQQKHNIVILTVSRLEERKNTYTLIKAFETLVQSSKDKQKIILVLVGQPGHGAEKIFDAITEARSKSCVIIHRAQADDKELAAWFSVAKVFVYPSLYEGFGLPILQAFDQRVPVITSHVSSIPEVGGEAVQYIHDAYNEDELAAAINSIIFNPDRSAKLVAHGTEQLKQFSWEKAAEETLEVLTSTAGT